MTFGEAVTRLLSGKAVRREVWSSVCRAELRETEGEGQLMIRTEADALWHPWTLSTSDLEADDWLWVVWAPPAEKQGRAVISPRPVSAPTRVEPPAQAMEQLEKAGIVVRRDNVVATPTEAPDDGLDGSDLLGPEK